MPTTTSTSIPKVERDPRLFTGFMTLVVIAISVITITNNPSLHEAGILIPFILVLVIHLALHWQIENITKQASRIIWYIIVQGIFAFILSWIGSETGLAFALFMALIGEEIGLLGLTRQGLLAGGFYLSLLVISLLHTLGWASAGWVLLGTAPLVIFVVIYVTLYMRQNDAREHAQSLAAELEDANRQLATYATQVEDLTLANERQRMARELHDTLAQGVAGMVLQLEAVKAHLEAGRGKRAATIIDQSLARARSTLADARAAIDDLRATPANLPDAVRTKIERFTQATGIPCTLDLALENAIPENVSDHALRILSEALTNITRHAQATEVNVRFINQNQQLELDIRDNGRGFEPESATRSGHYGLLGMRERARLVGGTLNIKSEPGQGTRIRLQIPLAPEGESS